MELPKKLKVGCFVFEVVQTSRVANEQALKGQCCHFDRQIRIDSDMKPCDKAEVMLHETLHAVDDFAKLNLSEMTICRLGNALAMVLVDNPELVRVFLPEEEAK